ncbi:MAG: ABC transporter ATP-binding protein [Desulfarculaceae bacterium]|jgi:ABC-type glutathione transport system ATPase component
MPDPLLVVEKASKLYPNPEGQGRFAALYQVSFTLGRGESLGLAGESGAGKTTLTRLILALEKPSTGRVLLKGSDLALLDRAQRKKIKRQVQIIWQDPYVFLNPYFSVRQLIMEPLQVLGLAKGEELTRRVQALLDMVDLPARCLTSRPHELSGGQCQRVAIARALAVEPELLICDEALASLDLLQQARLLSLLIELQERTQISYLFVSHNFTLLGKLCSKIAVLKEGQLVEIGAANDIMTSPNHAYTRSLVQASSALPLGQRPPLPSIG